MRGGGDTGARPVADQAAEQRERAVLVGRPQIGLVGDPLGVEGEQVTKDGRGVEQADRRVVGVRTVSPFRAGYAGEASRSSWAARKDPYSPTR